MELYERIKELRKTYLHLSQSEFGKRLGVSRSVINNIERNVLSRPEQKLSLMKLICSEFNVRKEWLFDGIEPIFVQPSTFTLDEYLKSKNATDWESDIINSYFKLDPDIRNTLLNKLVSLIIQGGVPMPLPNERTYTSDDYWNLPEGERAELIDGQIYSMAPPSRIHQKLLMEISGTIREYIRDNDGDCEIYPAPFAVNLDAGDKNWVEPDISVICDKSKLTDRGCSGAPDWIIEITSPSTQSHDYLKKLWLYQKHNVREYWIVNPSAKSVMVYDFEHGDSAGYSFDDQIPSAIYGSDLKICISELL